MFGSKVDLETACGGKRLFSAAHSPSIHHSWFPSRLTKLKLIATFSSCTENFPLLLRQVSGLNSGSILLAVCGRVDVRFVGSIKPSDVIVAGEEFLQLWLVGLFWY